LNRAKESHYFWGGEGQISEYRLRIAYSEDFCSVAEIYFHAPAQRGYEAELQVDPGSTIDLLVHNITLDDALAGAVRKPIKKRMTMHTAQDIADIKATLGERYQKALASWNPLSPEERLARDQAIWNWMPPINSQGGGQLSGVGQESAKQIEEQYGKWEFVGGEWGPILPGLGCVLTRDPKLQDEFLENRKLGLTYTMGDLEAGRPLPATTVTCLSFTRRPPA
jgi:hypothetical protein